MHIGWIFFYNVWWHRFNILMKFFTLDLLWDHYTAWIDCKLRSWMPVKLIFYYRIKTFLFFGFLDFLFIDNPLNKILYYYVWLDAKFSYKISSSFEVYSLLVFKYLKLLLLYSINFSNKIYSEFAVPFWVTYKTKFFLFIYLNDLLNFLHFSNFGMWLKHFFFFCFFFFFNYFFFFYFFN